MGYIIDTDWLFYAITCVSLALITVNLHTQKSALVNPVNSLKNDQ
jgi:heme exporter protein D